MPGITVSVREKIAQAEQGAAIVCGNSDYTIRFDFDSEWTGYPVRTARFAYVRDGVRLYQDLAFSGNSVQAPVMWGVTAVTVGVYAGNLRTTTGAVIPCTAAVTQSDPVHPAPAPDVYEQLLAYLERSGQSIGGAAAGIADGIISELIGGTAEEV